MYIIIDVNVCIKFFFTQYCFVFHAQNYLPMLSVDDKVAYREESVQTKLQTSNTMQEKNIGEDPTRSPFVGTQQQSLVVEFSIGTLYIW